MSYGDRATKLSEDNFSVEEMNAGQVTSQITKQLNLIASLDEAVSGLYKRLSEVTREREIEEDEHLTSPRETLVPIAGRIESHNDTILDITSRLRRLNDFIEL